MATQPEPGTGMMKTLRMAGEQQAIVTQQRGEFSQYRQLRLLIEIDHHITAEDCIQLLAYRPNNIKQIDTLKADHFLQFGTNLHKACFYVVAAHKELFDLLRRHHLDNRLQPVESGTRRLQYLGIQIGSDDPDSMVKAAKRIHRSYRHGVRFLPRRTGGAPQYDGPRRIQL